MFKLFMQKQPWLYKPLVEIFFILMPPFLCLLVIGLLPKYFSNSTEMKDYAWVILVLLIDVAHVYSTLYRTYFDKEMQQNQQLLLYATPLFAFIAGVLIYNLSSFLFWRIMAYVAVFHFIKQQYGFMRLYARKEHKSSIQYTIDKLVIYGATIYPMVFWHLTSDRNFNWFVSGDFLKFNNDILLIIFRCLYVLILSVYVVNFCYQYLKNNIFNLPKTLIILGTIVSWYFGIVYFNGDMAFTLLNVVSHGIPYMALIWLFTHKKISAKPSENTKFLRSLSSKFELAIFLAIIFILAYFEEGLWDGLVWHERSAIFIFFKQPFFNPSHQMLSFIVPLLALPQITHYIIDGFIWKIKKQNL